MTEVEFTHLLAGLADTAKTLNKESDSVNFLIARFEESLRAVNLGIEAWTGSITSKEWEEEDEHDGKVTASGTEDVELGFAKVGNEWRLLTRVARYRRDAAGDLNLVGTRNLMLLEKSSRDIRIGALPMFPGLVEDMKALGDMAIKAIQDAKKFVK